MEKRIFILAALLVPIALQAQSQRKLVWHEEFSYKGKPRASNWTYETGYLRNNELQYYTKDLSNARVHDGMLDIVCRTTGDSAHPITSASVTTRGKHAWTYGRIEVRAKIPSSLGTWPAIWMLATDIDKLGWPSCGEIDIMEHVGFDTGNIHTNIHTKAYNHVLKTNKGRATFVGRPSADFHVYAIDWTESKIDFYMDDRLLFTYNNEGTGPDTWPFNKPFYLILNFAYGGAWGGAKGVDNSKLPLHFLIDYVRVYQ